MGTYLEPSGRLWLFWRAWWTESRCTCRHPSAWRRWCWWSTPTTTRAPVQSCCPLELDRETDRDTEWVIKEGKNNRNVDVCSLHRMSTVETVDETGWIWHIDKGNSMHQQNHEMWCVGDMWVDVRKCTNHQNITEMWHRTWTSCRI